MVELTISRYDPRKDKEDLQSLVQDFNYRSIYPIDIESFSKEIAQRVLDLKLRNAILLARDQNKLAGAGFFSIWTDFLGNIHCVVHDVVVRKEDSFKKGIEENIMRELFRYIKNTMKINKVELYARKEDSNYQSLLLKMQIKKSTLDYYEHEL